MSKLFKLSAVAVVVILLSGASCQLSGLGQGQGGSFGVFKSFDSGKTWEQRVFVRQVKKRTETIGAANASVIRFDPNDPERIYLGTSNMGLWISENGSESWRELFPSANVQDVVIDGKNQIIYFATANSIYKSIDEGKTWPVLYLETRKDVAVTALAISQDNELYAGSSNGELLVSTDYGNSWKVVRRFENVIKRIVIRPGSADELFVATAERGVWRSADGGATWTDILTPMEKEIRNVRAYRDVAIDPAGSRVVYAMRYGIVVSNDNGATWGTPLNLLTAPDTIDFSTLAISARDSGALFYTTGRTLYRTFSGGERWETISLPGAGRPTALVAHPRDPGIVYLGEAK